MDIEKIIYNFIFDNVLTYAICIFIYYTFDPVRKPIAHIFENGNILLRAVTFITLILVLVIPALPQIAQLFAYLVAIACMLQLLYVIDISLHCSMIIKAVPMFLTAIILTVLINFIVGVLLEPAEVFTAQLIVMAWAFVIAPFLALFESALEFLSNIAKFIKRVVISIIIFAIGAAIILLVIRFVLVGIFKFIIGLL